MVNSFLLYLFIRRYLIIYSFLLPESVIISFLLLSFKYYKNESPGDSKDKKQYKKLIPNIDDYNSSSLIFCPNYSKLLPNIKPKINKIKIYGYHLLIQGDSGENKKYFLSKLFKNKISDLSYEMFNYCKTKLLFKNFNQDKNSEIGSMFIECLASLN